MRLYLSNVGFLSSNGIHHGVWEPGFENAKQFLNHKDAEDSSHMAASDLPKNKGIIVQRHTVSEDGKVKIEVVADSAADLIEEE